MLKEAYPNGGIITHIAFLCSILPNPSTRRFPRLGGKLAAVTLPPFGHRLCAFKKISNKFYNNVEDASG